MDHPFMAAVATELARRGIATLRYQFPYMERGARRPDPPQLAQATVRAAVAAALRLRAQDASALVREHVAWALEHQGRAYRGRRAGGTEATPPLL